MVFLVHWNFLHFIYLIFVKILQEDMGFSKAHRGSLRDMICKVLQFFLKKI